MEIKYPVDPNNIPMSGNFLRQLVLDANDTASLRKRWYTQTQTIATLQHDLEIARENHAEANADYNRLSNLIDDMVEERVKAIIKKRGYRTESPSYPLTTAKMSAEINELKDMLDVYRSRVSNYESNAFVDQQRIKGLEHHIDELLKLQPPFNALERIKKLERTIGEQKAHLRRLRAKLVHRAKVQGSLREDLHTFIDDNGRLRDEMRKQSGKLWRMERNEIERLRRMRHEERRSAIEQGVKDLLNAVFGKKHAEEDEL
jgi:hypothetical protein